MRHYCSDHKRPHNRLLHVITNPLLFFEHAYLCNCRNTTNIITTEGAELLLHFQKVMGLILSQKLTTLTEYFWCFSLYANTWPTSIYTSCASFYMFLSASFTNHLPFNTIQYDTMTASLTLWCLTAGVMLKMLNIRHRWWPFNGFRYAAFT